MRNPAKFVHVDQRHAVKLIGNTKGENDTAIDYRDLNIGADFMIKELFGKNKKRKEVAKLFSRKKKWDQMAKINTLKNVNDLK